MGGDAIADLWKVSQCHPEPCDLLPPPFDSHPRPLSLTLYSSQTWYMIWLHITSPSNPNMYSNLNNCDIAERRVYWLNSCVFKKMCVGEEGWWWWCFSSRLNGAGQHLCHHLRSDISCGNQIMMSSCQPIERDTSLLLHFDNHVNRTPVYKIKALKLGSRVYFFPSSYFLIFRCLFHLTGMMCVLPCVCVLWACL